MSGPGIATSRRFAILRNRATLDQTPADGRFMYLLYEHRAPSHRGRNATLIGLGVALVTGLIAAPPDTLLTTWSLWALATALLLLGTALFAIPPVVYIWIAPGQIILDPYGPHRRIPLQHIHDVEPQGSGPDATLILHLRNGDSVDLAGRIGDPQEVHSLLTDLGVTTRQAGGTALSDSLARRSGVDLLHGKAGKVAETNRTPEQEKDPDA